MYTIDSLKNIDIKQQELTFLNSELNADICLDCQISNGSIVCRARLTEIIFSDIRGVGQGYQKSYSLRSEV
jgi:hypothetical protein